MVFEYLFAYETSEIIPIAGVPYPCPTCKNTPIYDYDSYACSGRFSLKHCHNHARGDTRQDSVLRWNKIKGGALK